VLFEFDGFVLDESAFELRRDGEAVKLDPKAFGMLRYLLRRPGQLITRDELVRHVWAGRAQSDTVLTGTVSRLRAALGSSARDQFIVSVYGQGYRFIGNVRQQPSVSSKPSNETPFVGRAAVLERVQACLEQVRAGRGRIVAIVGEPGIGKTHLAEVCAEKATELGVPSAWGRCRELETAPPFWPFVQLLRGALRATSSSTLARSAVDGALSALRPERDPPAGWSAGASHYRLFDGISRALQRLTDDGPLFLVVDDLQWADAASLKLLAYLAPEIVRMRLLILATARDTAPAPGGQPLAPILGHRNCEYIELDRLTESDVAEYTALSFGGAASEVSRAVFEKSEGNPFFMVELLRPFWRTSAPRVDELALTGPALDIVRERLRTLSPKAVSLLSAAAIVGRDFDLGLLGHVSELDPQTILDLLDEARETGTVRPTVDPPGHFVFRHDLIRSVLLANLSTSQSARLHLRAADALEGRFPVGAGVPRAEIVHHLLTALPLGDSEKAVDYATRSALAAAQVCAHADAAKLLRRALSALELVREVHPRSRCELLLRLSFCERALADEYFAEHLSQAVALGREHGFGEILAEAGRHMSLAPGFLVVKGARDVLEAADRALPADSHLLRSDVLAHLAWTAPYCFDSELVAPLVARAEALARESKDPTAMAIALSAKMYFSKGPDSQELAEAISHQIEILYAEQPPLIRVHWSAQKEFSRIVVSLQRGDAASVERAIASFGAAARELKHPELEWHHQRAGIVDRMNRGPWFGLKDALQDLQDRADALHLFSSRGVRAVDWIVLVRETQHEEALLPLESALVLQEADCPYRRGRKIRSLAELGATEKARTALNDLRPERLERLPHDRDYLATLVHLSVASIATRSQEHAQVLYTLLSPYPHLYAADLSLHCDGSVSHFLGELARSLGRIEKSVEHLEVALDRNERAGLRPRVAHSAYALASVLSQSANRKTAGRARALYARARELSLELGLEPLRHRVEHHLRTA
jgi:DNA-binding winged helix-turn-helix (wHTH) protein/tetratricopeptide (TPR) repeat protein